MRLKKIAQLIFLINVVTLIPNADLTIVGPVKFSDGIFRLSLTWMAQLQNDIKINFVSTGFVDLSNVDNKIKKIISKSLNNFKYIQKNPGNVAVLLSSPWTVWGNHADHMPNSKIKIAYSMLEGTQIPEQWVQNFNDKFDAVVVPDSYFVQVYQNCGVRVPIFVLPIALMLNDFLTQPLKTKPNKIFRFGSSAVFIPGKNHETALRAFIKTFGNQPNVELVLHGRGGDEKQLKEIIEKEKIKNVFLINKSLSPQEYLKLFKSLDCYILLSQGEGFSITPREAMALGIPCILSNNTAQSTVCQTGLVESIKSEILIPAYYSPFNANVGHKFNCTVDDAAYALQNVHQNYLKFLANSQKMRRWARSYNYPNLKAKYLTLVKPANIVYGSKNIIDDGILTTNSITLFNKYKEII